VRGIDIVLQGLLIFAGVLAVLGLMAEDKTQAGGGALMSFSTEQIFLIVAALLAGIGCTVC